MHGCITLFINSVSLRIPIHCLPSFSRPVQKDAKIKPIIERLIANVASFIDRLRCSLAPMPTPLLAGLAPCDIGNETPNSELLANIVCTIKFAVEKILHRQSFAGAFWTFHALFDGTALCIQEQKSRCLIRRVCSACSPRSDGGKFS